MKSRRRMILVPVAAALALLAVLLVVAHAAANPSQQESALADLRPADEAGSQATAAAYDSGWVDIAPGQMMTLTHNLGGDPAGYAVELWQGDTRPGGLGIHHRGYGGMEVNGQFYGVAWQSLTATTISVFRYQNDVAAAQVRVRIWIPEPPEYDSGWVAATPGGVVTLTHSVGGTPDDYVVGLKFSGIAGISHRAYGGLAVANDMFGANFQNVTGSTVGVFRFPFDLFAQQVRVTVSLPADPPDYDSGWVDISAGSRVTLTHSLGGNPNAYVVRMSVKDTTVGGLGINSRFTGGLEVVGKFYGANWENLTHTTITLFRRPHDTISDQVRIRIWLPERKRYLPLALSRYPAAVETELAYDDGTGSEDASWEAGKGFAVCFSPPAGQVKVVRARYYLYDPRPIEVHVWDYAAHNNLITPFTANTTAEGWNDVDLSAYNIVVSGDFCLGFLHLEAYRPTLGSDFDPPIYGRSYEVDGAYWQQQVGKDYMIRAVVVGQ